MQAYALLDEDLGTWRVEPDRDDDREPKRRRCDDAQGGEHDVQCSFEGRLIRRERATAWPDIDRPIDQSKTLGPLHLLLIEK